MMPDTPEQIVAVCYCGAEIERIGNERRGGFWRHTEPEDRSDPRWCYAEERGMDEDSRCVAMPDPDGVPVGSGKENE